MSLTSTQIDEIFAAMGLPAPSSAVATSLEAIPNTYDALNTIIDLPEVQSEVIPILAMFDLSLGHDPTSATLASMVENNGGNIASIANQFVESQTFANLYNAGTLLSASTIVDASNSGIITALFVNGLGHPPTTATLEGFFGLTLGQAFLDFTQSNAIAETPTIDASLTNIMELAAGIPAQAPVIPSQSFTLTNGSDTVIAGQNTVGTTAPGTLVIQSTALVPEDTVINAPLSGPFGNQPTLTLGDVIDLSSSVGGANTLNALFSGTDFLTSMTIKGVQTWNITQAGPGPSIILLEGTPGTIDGLTTLNYNGNGFLGSELLVGAPGTNGIDGGTAGEANGFNLSLTNVPGGGVDVFFAPNAFAGNDTINITANAVGNTLGGTSTSFFSSTDIEAGSAGATGGFVNWVVASTGANAVNDIALSTNGSKTAPATLTVTDDGSSTIIWAGASPSEWAQLTTIDALGTTGTLTITGHENSTTHGLLADDTSALTLVEGGSGADTFDLSAFGGATGGSVAGLSIIGGANTTIELSNTEINFVSAAGAAPFAEWTSVAVLDDVASPGVGGAINMAQFPGTLTVSLLSPTSGLDPNQTANLVVTNAPDGLNFDFNDTNQHSFDFSVVGSDTAGGAGNIVNVNYDNLVNSLGSFSSQNFDFVNVNLSGAASSGVETFYFLGTTAVANADAPETLTINASLTHGGGETILVGNVTTEVLGQTGIELLGGGISVSPPTALFNETGTLDITGTDNVVIGVTNASTITSTTSGVFDMTSPDDINLTVGAGALWVAGTHDTVSSSSAGSTLQGVLTGTGPADLTPGTGTDSLTDTAGGSQFYGDGGANSITIGGGGNDVFFGQYLLNDTAHTQTITTSAGHAALGFWGATSNGEAIFGSPGAIFGTAAFGGTEGDITNITGFELGAGGDALTFKVAAWSGGLIDPLTQGTITTPGTAENAAFDLGFAGETLSAPPSGIIRLMLDQISEFSGASELAQALHTATVGNFNFSSGVANGATLDFLVAYEVTGGTGINIADVEVHNGSGATQTNTANMSVYASDMVHLAGITSLTSLGLNAGEIHFV